MSEYTNRRIPPKHSELQVYTWLDATLSELTGLIRETPAYQAKGVQFNFSKVFPEPSSPTFRMRTIGNTTGGKRGSDDDLTLAQCRYQIGDFLDVAILPPGAELPRPTNQSNKPIKRNRNRNNRLDLGPPGRFHR